MTTLTLNIPAGICVYCYRTWRATKPRPVAVWCWHSRSLARVLPDNSWKVLTNITDGERWRVMRALEEGSDLPPEAA